jgi:hypothetical protein
LVAVITGKDADAGLASGMVKGEIYLVADVLSIK